jgi:predicted dehydrogenase
MLRGAIIGLGSAASQAHLPGWLQRHDVEIVAASDPRPEQRRVITTHLPHVQWYDSAAELMAREVLDFVDICTPPVSHTGLVRSALERGLHVLCEKPLVCALDDLTELARLVETRRRVLHTVHNWNHAPIIQRTRELLHEGAIGRVQRVTWHTLRTRPAGGDAAAGNWRLDPAISGGGILTDHGWHAFYILARWIGQIPTAIRARLETRRHRQWRVEDTATIELTFPEATAEVLLTWASDVRQNRAELVGSEGTLSLEDDTLALRRPGPPPHEQRWPCPPALSDGSYHPDWFEQVAVNFVDAIHDRVPRTANLAEASLCVALEALARESSRRGRALSLSSLSAIVPIAGLFF